MCRSDLPSQSITGRKRRSTHDQNSTLIPNSPPVIVLFLEHARGNALEVPEQRVVQIQQVHVNVAWVRMFATALGLVDGARAPTAAIATRPKHAITRAVRRGEKLMVIRPGL